MTPLAALDVLVIDCQATAAAPAGHLLELGWGHAPGDVRPPRSRLVRLPPTTRVPPAVARVTGITEVMTRDGVAPASAWGELWAEAARLAPPPVPAIAHYARFERPFLTMLAGATPGLDLVCTHDIARRLLPHLPRRSLRALAGYFGHAVPALRRSGEHVEATRLVWRALLPLLDAEGVIDWGALRDWLSVPAPSLRGKRCWPMPRECRLALPDAPGVYRMLRTSGDVIYVGKASSLHHRVNSYFRKQHGIHDRTLEMLSQARALSIEVTPTALEAALLESDEIKRHRPPYNVALRLDARDIWFASLDLMSRQPRPGAGHPLGPFPSPDLLDQFAALARGDRAALGTGRWAPAASTFDEGLVRLRAAHAELRNALSSQALLHLGRRLVREGWKGDADDEEGDDGARRSNERWTPESVQRACEGLAVRMAVAQRRARWLARLVDASVTWREPGAASARVLAIAGGEVAFVRDHDDEGAAPPPPASSRLRAGRLDAFTLARFDRLRVLTTELKRLVADHAPVTVRFGNAIVLANGTLARVFARV